MRDGVILKEEGYSVIITMFQGRDASQAKLHGSRQNSKNSKVVR